ncbi:MAG: zf-HC2 domain-containing protein [Gemmatimonadota bacterium]
MNDEGHAKRGPDDGPPLDPGEATCEESLALVYEFLDGELEPDRTERVRRHLEKCRRCYPYFDFERLFLDFLHERGGAGRAGPELERRVRALLEES